MHILVDGIHLTHNMKGVGRYVLNTLKEMTSLDRSLELSVLLLNGNGTLDLPATPRIKWIRVPWRNHLWHGFWTLPLWARRLQPDMVWVPYEVPFSTTGRPYVMVCHDVPRKLRIAQQQKQTHPSSVKELLRDWLDDKLLTSSLLGAKIVFSNSHYVAGWLEEEVGLKSTQIRYAPCAPGADFDRLSQSVNIADVRQRLGTDEGYILVFHTGDPRENFRIVPEVYQRVVESGLPHALVIAGVRNASQVEALLSRFEWYERVRIVPFLEAGEEQELANIYTAASLYLDPSLQEGFGMQVIEAMSCRTAVVCSNRGALPEVTDGAALLINPEEPSEMASAVTNVLTDQQLSQQLVKRGYRRAGFFSWERTAKVIYEGLLDVIGTD